jgi:hypothetical protein
MLMKGVIQVSKPGQVDPLIGLRQNVFYDFLNRIMSFNFLNPLVYFFSFIGFLVWVGSIQKADFWADDFSHLNNFNKNLGAITSSDGKLVINVYWFFGSYAFGSSSAVPYLLMNMAFFITSIFILHKIARSRGWGRHYIFYVCAMLFSTGSIYAFLLWSSNVVHLASLLGLCIALLIQEKARIEKSIPVTLLFGFLLGLVWTFATLSNPLYIGFLILAAYFVYEQLNNHKNYSSTFFKLKLILLNLSLPVLAFVFISYPRVTKQEAYDVSGLKFISSNFDYYFMGAFETPKLILLVVIGTLALLILMINNLRNLEFASAVFLLTASSIVFPILIQGQQRGIHYFSIPIILFLASIFSIKPDLKQLFRKNTLFFFSRLGVATLIVLVAVMGSWARSWYLTSPFGEPLTQIRQSIASSTIPGQSICLELEMPSQDQNFFLAAMGGTSGFLVHPINASNAQFNHIDGCVQSADRYIKILLSERGSYVVGK